MSECDKLYIVIMVKNVDLAGMEASDTPHVLSPFLYPCR